MKKIISIIVLVCFVFYSCKEETKNLPGPASDLGHIDLILDSATWEAVRNDSFMQKEFTIVNNDTGNYGGKPSYDLYLLGQLNFLHISQAKGFWADQRGGGVLIFQTQKPGMIDSVLLTWKQYFYDSLDLHTYKGSDFTLYEAMAWYKIDSTRPKEPVMFANLTSYSKDAYKNWGITDSVINAGLAMKQFMADWGGQELNNKLFHSIRELHMTINEKELVEIRSALLASGYTEADHSFTHPQNPLIFITVSDEKGKSKYSKVEFNLSRAVEERELVFSPSLRLKLKNEEAELLIQ